MKPAWSSLLLFVFSCGIALAADPALLVLEYADGAKRIQTSVPAKVGVSAPSKPVKPQLMWTVRPGAAMRGAVPPHRIDFYQAGKGDQSLLCTLEVRYFRGRGGWVPHYRVHEEVMLVRDGDRLRPISIVDGAPALIQHRSNALPNVEGYYPYLEFGLTTGTSTIAGWRVTPLPAN